MRARTHRVAEGGIHRSGTAIEAKASEHAKRMERRRSYQAGAREGRGDTHEVQALGSGGRTRGRRRLDSAVFSGDVARAGGGRFPTSGNYSNEMELIGSSILLQIRLEQVCMTAWGYARTQVQDYKTGFWNSINILGKSPAWSFFFFF